LNWRIPFACAALLAAASPLLPLHSSSAGSGGFPGWPANWEGASLTPMPGSPQDEYFTRDFPGKVARFAAGDAQVVIRWVNSPTRRLHPAAHCFTGAGYHIEPRPMRQSRGEGGSSGLMSCFAASKGSEVLDVCEQLRDGTGNSWPDVSAWYWNAVAAPAGSSWWSFVVVERVVAGREPTDHGS
jgi:hypothetical protein